MLEAGAAARSELGRVLVQMTFKISRRRRRSPVAGSCRVSVERNARARVIRDNTILGEYPIDTLRREKDDVKEVREGLRVWHQAGRLQRH